MNSTKCYVGLTFIALSESCSSMDACVYVHGVLRLVVLPQYIISPATPGVSAIPLPFSRILVVESAGEAKRAEKINILLFDQLFHRSAVLGSFHEALWRQPQK